MFKEEEKLIHYHFGVGTVKSIEIRNILGTRSRMAVCIFNGEEMELLINTERACRSMRPLISEEELPEVLEHLESYEPPPPKTNWNVRRNQYNTKIKSGDIYQRCEVIKDLLHLAQKKSLSKQEQLILENSRTVLVAELAQVSGLEQAKLEDRVNRLAASLN